MGNTRNTGYLQNIVQYDASNNITLPARLAVTGSVAVNNTTPYDTTQFSLDVNGGLIVKNTGKAAQIALINSDPAAGGNAGFVIHTVGGTSTSSYADIQGYYGTSIAGSTVIRLNPQGGNVLVGSLAGTGSRMVVADSTGVLSTQAIITLDDLSGTPTSRTLTIDGVSYDLSANRTWSVLPTGGATGDILAKVSGTNYDVTWIPNYTSQVQHIVKAAVALTKGQAVYVSSADGTNMIISKASNATEGTSSKTLGLVAQDLAINGQGFVVTEGLLAGLDTSTATAGDPVWLGTDGNLIFGLLNKPTAPAHLVFIGIVTRVQSNNGEIFVKVQNGFELDELHDLSVKNASDGDMIKYVASTGLWTKIAAATTNITEGTNLYYTDARVGTYLTTNSYATQSYVSTQIANLVDSAPTTLDTLNELAAALGDDPNFATTVSTSIGTKVPQTRTITINGTAYDLSADRSWSIAAGVTAFNTRTGAITLSLSDVTTALGYTPYNSSNPNGYISSYTETDTLASVTSRGNTTTSILYVYPNLSAEPYVSAHFYNTNSSTTRYGGILVSGIEQAHLRLMYGSNDWSSASAKKWQIRVRMDNSQDLFKIFNWQSSKDVWSINSSAEEFLAAEDNGTATSRRYYNYASNEHRFYAVNAAGATTAVKLMEYDGGSYQRVLTTGNYSTYALPLSGGTMSGSPIFTAVYGNPGGDYTAITNPAYKVDVASGYWRVVYKSASPTNSGVYNYETGKHVYWGEPTDTGNYNFRGRTLKWTNSSGTEYDIIHTGNYTSYRGTQLISPNGGTVVAADSAMPDAGHSFIHTLALGPGGNDGHILGMTWASTTTVYGAQIFLDTDPNDIMAIRSRSSSGVWTGWKTVIHSGTIGSQSVSYATTAGSASANGGTADYAHQLKWYGAGATPQSANTFQKGILSNYYGGGAITDVPESNYGSLYNFGGYDASSLSLQLFSTVNHNSTSSTRTLYFRMGNNLGFQNDWKALLDSTNYSSYAVPLSGGVNLSNGLSFTGYNTPNAITVGSGDVNWSFGSYADGGTQYWMQVKYYGTNDDNRGFRILNVNGSTVDFRVNGSGNGIFRGDVTAYSDARVKENIITVDNALSKVLALRGVYYNRIDTDTSIRKIGVIAQETLPIIPEVVTKGNDEMYTVAYGNMAGLFIEAIKELKAENDTQKTEIEELKDLVKQLINR